MPSVLPAYIFIQTVVLILYWNRFERYCFFFNQVYFVNCCLKVLNFLENFVNTLNHEVNEICTWVTPCYVLTNWTWIIFIRVSVVVLLSPYHSSIANELVMMSTVVQFAHITSWSLWQLLWQYPFQFGMYYFRVCWILPQCSWGSFTQICVQPPETCTYSPFLTLMKVPSTRSLVFHNKLTLTILPIT